MIRATFPVVLFLCALTAAAQTDTPKTVSTAEATRLVTQRVEPTVPPIAKAVKIGGKVRLHIVIGHVCKRSPSANAGCYRRRQAVEIQTLSGRRNANRGRYDVELALPGGMSESESAARDRYSQVEDECRSLVNGGKYVEGEPKCREAVEIS